jgi:antitoxin HicB
MFYPITLTTDSGVFLATAPDIPEMAAVGDNEAEALREAVDALETALDFYFEKHRPIPLPSKAKRGQTLVALPALVTGKVLLHNEMLAQGVKKVELARRLNIAPPNVNRIFDLKHKTRIETIEAALSVLGKRLDVRIAV